MYNVGAPIGGGIVGVGVLATTGLNTFAITLLAVLVLMAGLVLMRWATLRRARPATEAAGPNGRRRPQHAGGRAKH